MANDCSRDKVWIRMSRIAALYWCIKTMGNWAVHETQNWGGTRNAEKQRQAFSLFFLYLKTTMVSLWWGQSALEELIGTISTFHYWHCANVWITTTLPLEKATSELLPAGQEDLVLHLEISDQIRSKKVNAKDAMRSLKRRLEHKNPNVQLATLSVSKKDG